MTEREWIVFAGDLYMKYERKRQVKYVAKVFGMNNFVNGGLLWYDEKHCRSYTFWREGLKVLFCTYYISDFY